MTELAKAAWITVPSNIRWFDGISESIGGKVTMDGSNLWLRWDSKYKTFQVQTRKRYRISPSGHEVGYSGDFSDWSDWTPAIGASDTSTVTVDIGNGSVLMRAPFSFAGFELLNSYYDLVEVEARVRAINVSTYEVSEWCSSVLTVGIVPDAEVSAIANDDGSATCNILSMWERSLSVGFGDVYSSEDLKITNKVGTGILRVGDIQPVETDDGFLFSFNIPAKYIAGLNRIYPTYFMLSTDEAYGSINRQWITIENGAKPEPAVKPSLTVVREGYGARIALSGSGTYSFAKCTATWSDNLGFHCEQIKMSGSGGHWSGLHEYPPFSTEITYKVSYQNGTGYSTTTAVFELDSDGHDVWTGNGHEVSLKWGLDRETGFTPNAEYVQTTAETPLARYGNGGKRSIKVKAWLINGFGTWIEDFQLLNEPHQWVYRQSDGTVRNVLVTATEYKEAQISREHVAEVSVTMVEVA